MTIHTVRLDIITTMDQHRIDTITIIIIDHLRLRVIMDHLIVMGHLISIDLIAISRITINLPQREVVDKKYNEIKKIIIIL